MARPGGEIVCIQGVLLTAREAGRIISRHREKPLPTLSPTPMLRPQTDALRGSIDLLVLKTLSLAPMHGWGIGNRVQQLSTGTLEINQGSLYPALQRLEKSGLITSRWEATENNRRARYYRLTAAGRRALGDEIESWRRFASAMETVIQTQ